MKITLTGHRVRMAGFPPDAPQCSYTVECSLEQLTPEQRAACTHFIVRDGKRYALLYERFLPAGFEELPALSAQRSAVFAEAMAKANAARKIVLEALFPETRGREIGDLWHPTPPQYAFSHEAHATIDTDDL